MTRPPKGDQQGEYYSRPIDPRPQLSDQLIAQGNFRQHRQGETSMIYLASPYTMRDNPSLEADRFSHVCDAAGLLMLRGVLVFSPIAHSHPIALSRPIPTDWAYWQPFAEKMIGSCLEVWILMLAGWETSTGISAELKIADKKHKPTRMLDPVFMAAKPGVIRGKRTFKEVIHRLIDEGYLYDISQEGPLDPAGVAAI